MYLIERTTTNLLRRIVCMHVYNYVSFISVSSALRKKTKEQTDVDRQTKANYICKLQANCNAI